MGKVVVKYESAVKEVDVTLAVSGGDAGRGPKQQKTEITIYTIRNGVVNLPCICPAASSHCMPADERHAQPECSTFRSKPLIVIWILKAVPPV